MANPENQSSPRIRRSEQYIQNASFDEAYQVLAVELLGENSAGNALVRLKATDTGLLATSGDQDQDNILNTIATAVQAIASAKGTAADVRVTVLGGSLVISSGTITTVTTVASLTNMVNVGSQPATTMIPSISNGTAVLSNINNVV